MDKVLKMKQITVTDKQYEALRHMAELMCTQNNRATEHPIFCVYQKEQRLSEDGFCEIVDEDREVVFQSEDDMVEAFENKTEFMREHCVSSEQYDSVVLDSCAYENICALMVWEQRYYKEVDVPVGGQYYFTEEACHKHIKMNSYHYNKPFSFVESPWRNPEMQLLRDVALSISIANEGVNSSSTRG